MSKAGNIFALVRRLNQYKEGKTAQPGMFSTLDEVIKEAPFDTNSADQWAKYLTPGRMLKREGAQFPLKKEELEHSGLSERLSSGILGDHPVTKEELRAQLLAGRPEFRLDIGREIYDEAGDNPSVQRGFDTMPYSWEEAGRQGTKDPMSGEYLDIARIEPMDPKYGADYGGAERYHHTSPNSTYDESVTRIKGLSQSGGHFGSDTVSWSRTTSHELPQKSTEIGFHPTKVRLIEEIQSDVHRKASEKLWRDPRSGEHFTSREAAEAKTSWDPDDIEEVGRIGYRTPDTTLEIAGLREEAAQLDAKLKRMNPLTAAGNPSRKYQTMSTDFNRLIGDIDRLEMKVADAPYKSPQSYAQMELRKQLMSAVDNGEDYLALTRGSDQIERYGGSAELGDKRMRGMETMYDTVYAGELKKLAKRYGATVEDIEVPLSSAADVRPSLMRELEMNHPDEFFNEAIADMKQFKDPAAVKGELDEMSEMVSEVRGSISDLMGDDAYLDSFDDMLRKLDQIKQTSIQLGNQQLSVGRRGEYLNKVVAKTREVRDEFAIRYREYKEIFDTGASSGGGLVTKTFPAIHITPEVREKILEHGVAQFQHGGLVRPDQYPGVEYIPKMEELQAMTNPELDRLREINDILSGGAPKRELLESMEEAQLYEDPQYWKDVPKHGLAAMTSMWKTLDPETGEAEWNFGASAPPFELVERGLMPLEEWKELKETADRVSEEKPARPGIIDETIAMRALMTEIANIFRDERVEPPQYAAEAMERSERLQRAVEEGMDLDPAVGFPQRFSQMMGFMLGQVPSPKSLTEATGAALVKAMPKVTAKIPKALKVGVGAPLEFIDPTIRPALSTYLTGATAGTGMIYGIEGMAERRLKELEEQLEEDAEQE